MEQLAHYAESYCVTSGQCFRMIQALDGTGHAQHCPFLTVWRGRFQDVKGKWWTVESRDGHRADLDSVQKIGRTAPLRSGLPWRA